MTELPGPDEDLAPWETRYNQANTRMNRAFSEIEAGKGSVASAVMRTKAAKESLTEAQVDVRIARAVTVEGITAAIKAVSDNQSLLLELRDELEVTARAFEDTL